MRRLHAPGWVPRPAQFGQPHRVYRAGARARGARAHAELEPHRAQAAPARRPQAAPSRHQPGPRAVRLPAAGEPAERLVQDHRSVSSRAGPPGNVRSSPDPRRPGSARGSGGDAAMMALDRWMDAAGAPSRATRHGCIRWVGLVNPDGSTPSSRHVLALLEAEFPHLPFVILEEAKPGAVVVRQRDWQDGAGFPHMWDREVAQLEARPGWLI